MIFVSLSAQEEWFQLEAQVVDRETNEVLPFANVQYWLDGVPKEGVATDQDGFFRLKVPEDARVSVSYIGYKTADFAWWELRKLEFIFLEPESSTLTTPVVRARLEFDDLYSPTVERLSEEQLLVGDAINISQAFDGLPGVQVQQGALNTQRLSLRGIGARTPFATDQVRLYWNDIPLTNGAGESVLEDIETGFLRKAYVQTGPAPAALGANLGGSIQLVSKEWAAPNWGLSGGGSFGSFSRNREWVNLHNEVNNWQQDVSVVRSASAGYRDNNEYERLSGTVLGRFGEKGATFYLLHLRQLQAEIPSSLTIDDFNEKPEAAAFTWAAVNGREDQLTYLAGIQHSRRIASLGEGWGDLRNRSSVFGGRRTNDEVRPFNIINEDSYQYGLRSVFSLAKATKVKGQLQAGGELFLERYDQTTFQVLDGGAQGEELGDARETRFYYFAFANWQAHWGERWQTTVDVNLRQTAYNWETSNGDRDYTFAPFLSPGFTLAYETPDRQFRAHARINRGISQPDASSAIENTSNGSIRVNELRPAFGWNRELGLQLKMREWQLSVTGFQMNLEDILVQRPDSIEGTFLVNGGSARHQGVEAQLGRAWELGEGQLRILSSYTLADYSFLDFEDTPFDFSGNDIPGNPRHRWRSQLDWSYSWLRTQAIVDLASKQWVDDANTATADGYTLLHLRVGAHFEELGRGLRIYAGCNNVFDTLYASMVQVNAAGFGGNLPRSYYPGLPRYFYLGVDYGL